MKLAIFTCCLITAASIDVSTASQNRVSGVTSTTPNQVRYDRHTWADSTLVGGQPHNMVNTTLRLPDPCDAYPDRCSSSPPAGSGGNQGGQSPSPEFVCASRNVRSGGASSGSLQSPLLTCSPANIGQKYLAYASCIPVTESTCSGGSFAGYECTANGWKPPYIGASLTDDWAALQTQGVQDLSFVSQGRWPTGPYPAYYSYQCKVP